jgi:hypothetical protein
MNKTNKRRSVVNIIKPFLVIPPSKSYDDYAYEPLKIKQQYSYILSNSTSLKNI